MQGNFKSYVVKPTDHSKSWSLTDFGHALSVPYYDQVITVYFTWKGETTVATWECGGIKSSLAVNTDWSISKLKRIFYASKFYILRSQAHKPQYSPWFIFLIAKPCKILIFVPTKFY